MNEEYHIYVDGEWAASTNDLGEATHYYAVYSADGSQVEILTNKLACPASKGERLEGKQ